MVVLIVIRIEPAKIHFAGVADNYASGIALGSSYPVTVSDEKSLINEFRARCHLNHSIVYIFVIEVVSCILSQQQSTPKRTITRHQSASAKIASNHV